MNEYELIELIAKRICAENFDKWDARGVHETLSGNEPKENRDSYRFIARAALTALREAGYKITPRDGNEFAEGIEAAAAFLESQSAKSSVPELTAYRTWAHEVRKLKVRSKDPA